MLGIGYCGIRESRRMTWVRRFRWSYSSPRLLGGRPTQFHLPPLAYLLAPWSIHHNLKSSFSSLPLYWYFESLEPAMSNKNQRRTISKYALSIIVFLLKQMFKTPIESKGLCEVLNKLKKNLHVSTYSL